MGRGCVIRCGLASIVLCLPVSLSAASETADLILHNARVYTANARLPWAEGLVITDERIIAVGSNAAVLSHRRPATRVIDLAGAFVSPGFNDAHVHVDSTGMLITGVNLLDIHEARAVQPPCVRSRLRWVPALFHRFPRAAELESWPGTCCG